MLFIKICETYVAKIGVRLMANMFCNHDVLSWVPFAKLRKSIVSFVLSFYLSVRMEQLSWHRYDFHEI